MPETPQKAAPADAGSVTNVLTSDVRLDEFPTAIRAALAELHAVRKALPTLKDNLKAAEDDLREVIRPQHSNQAARDAAFRAQKETDSAWAQANADYQGALDSAANLEGEVEELRGRFALALISKWAEVGSIALKPVQMVIQMGVADPTAGDVGRPLPTVQGKPPAE